MLRLIRLMTFSSMTQDGISYFDGNTFKPTTA